MSEELKKKLIQDKETEIEGLRETIDRLDDQGRVDFKLSSRLNELVVEVQSMKKFLSYAEKTA